ncbi:histidine phosphatase family protein [Dongia sp.]|uniref:histidine phosphatase family protein n=1 Tax=Dongia sp. TaxID=1977262 RepID=UPI0035B071E2
MILKIPSIRRWLPAPWWAGPLRLAGAGAALLGLACAAMAINAEFDEARAIAELQQGGQVVYVRHAARISGPRDNLTLESPAADFANCGAQRNLTPEGREQARRLGHYWRDLRIPVTRVVASPQCRTRDTAIIAFGHAQVERRLFDLDFTRSLLLEPAEKHGNTVVVASDFQLRELTGTDLRYAEAAVVKSDGKGGLVVVARLDLGDWEEAAEPSWW